MLTTKEQEKLKDILFSEIFDITYESCNFYESDKYHIYTLASKHFTIYISTNTNTSSFCIKVLYIDKENDIDISDLFSDEEIIDILKNTKKRQIELERKAKEEEKERKENILRKFIKKFK